MIDPESKTEATLESWKEIAAHLGRQVKTVQRWEKDEALPVHRHSHKARASVYAYPSEIDAWREARKVLPAPPPPRPLWKMPAFGLTMALCLVMVGNGLRPQKVEAQGTGPVARQVFVVKDEDPGAGGAISWDGRYVSFMVDSTGDLGVRNLGTGVSRRLTDSGGWVNSGDYAAQSRISRDGRQVAYLWERWSLPEPNRGMPELRVIPIEGGNPRTIVKGTKEDYMLPFGWSPDGRQILVIRKLADRTGQIAMVGVEDGSIRVIKSVGWQPNGSADLSPDGKFIAYEMVAGPASDTRDIYVLAADGSGENLVVSGPSSETRPMWSPDGSQILFLSDRTGDNSLWSIPVRNGKAAGPVAMLHATLGGNLGITRSGALYHQTSSFGTDLYVAQLDANAKVVQAPVLAADRFLHSNAGPAPSPDGKTLAFNSKRGGEVKLVLRTIATGKEREFELERPPTITARTRGPLWFPDSRSLLVQRRSPTPGTGLQLLRLDVGDGKTELLLERATGQEYSLSPDGKSLYFTDREVPERPLLRFNLETKTETVLLKEGKQITMVAASQDGKQLAYLAQVDGVGSSLAVMPSEGGPSRIIYRGEPTADGTRFSLSWTPDGRSLVFARPASVSGERETFWRVPVDGGQLETLGISATGLKRPEMLSDGRIFYQVRESDPAEVWALENFLPMAASAR